MIDAESGSRRTSTTSATARRPSRGRAPIARVAFGARLGVGARGAASASTAALTLVRAAETPERCARGGRDERAGAGSTREPRRSKRVQERLRATHALETALVHRHSQTLRHQFTQLLPALKHERTINRQLLKGEMLKCKNEL